jgi:hypothetical protein
LPDN